MQLSKSRFQPRASGLEFILLTTEHCVVLWWLWIGPLNWDRNVVLQDIRFIINILRIQLWVAYDEEGFASY